MRDRADPPPDTLEELLARIDTLLFQALTPHAQQRPADVLRYLDRLPDRVRRYRDLVQGIAEVQRGYPLDGSSPPRAPLPHAPADAPRSVDATLDDDPSAANGQLNGKLRGTFRGLRALDEMQRAGGPVLMSQLIASIRDAGLGNEDCTGALTTMLSRFKSDGLITATGTGAYSITAAGEQHLARQIERYGDGLRSYLGARH